MLIILVLLSVVIAIVLIILLAIKLSSSTEDDDELSLLYEIEEAYIKSIETKNITPMYNYATIPMAMNISNKLRYDMIYAKGNVFKNSETEFIEREDLNTNLSTVFERIVTFSKVKGEPYSYGDNIRELWFIDNNTFRLKRIEEVGKQ